MLINRLNSQIFSTSQAKGLSNVLTRGNTLHSAMSEPENAKLANFSVYRCVYADKSPKNVCFAINDNSNIELVQGSYPKLRITESKKSNRKKN